VDTVNLELLDNAQLRASRTPRPGLRSDASVRSFGGQARGFRWLIAVAMFVAVSCAREPSKPGAAESARPSEPRTVDVAANQAWQDTGIRIEPSRPFKLAYVSGQISDRLTSIADGNGSDYACGGAGCCEPLPAARRSALIGQVGADTFIVGNGGTFTVQSGGTLRLRVNDCDGGLYDNSGVLKVQFTP
jgi:hypothetical protein